MIPCANEAGSIARVVTDVRAHLAQVIVVDDGSSDGAAAEAQSAGATVIVHSRNRGKGAALRTGWREAWRRGIPWALTLDGDGQHAAGDIPKFFAAAEASRAPLIVGDRMSNPAGMPWLRRTVNLWMSRRLSRATSTCLPDSQCGFRLVNLAVLNRLDLATERFEIESEMLTAFVAAGHRVEFVPVEVIYLGGSKIHPIIDGWRWLRWFYQHSASRQTVTGKRPWRRTIPVP